MGENGGGKTGHIGSEMVAEEHVGGYVCMWRRWETELKL